MTDQKPGERGKIGRHGVKFEKEHLNFNLISKRAHTQDHPLLCDRSDRREDAAKPSSPAGRASREAGEHRPHETPGKRTPDCYGSELGTLPKRVAVSKR